MIGGCARTHFPRSDLGKSRTFVHECRLSGARRGRAGGGSCPRGTRGTRGQRGPRGGDPADPGRSQGGSSGQRLRSGPALCDAPGAPS